MSLLSAEKDGGHPAAVARPRVDDLVQDAPLPRFVQQHFENGFDARLRREKKRRQSILVGGVNVDGGNSEENLDDAMEAVMSGEMKGRPTAEVGLKRRGNR